MKITHVQMSKALHVPSLGKQVERTISGEPQSMPGIVFTETTNGVHVKFRNISFLIPFSMIECVVYANEA